MGRRVRSAILIGLIWAVWLYSSAVWAAWTVERVDAPHSFSSTSSPRAIALDGGGMPHIVYGEDNLYHAYVGGTEDIPDWNASIGGFASIAIDGSGYLHISCYDQTNRQLMYATNASGSWVLERITTLGGGMYSVIALNASGLPCIVSVKSGLGQMVYSTKDGSGAWTHTNVYTGAGIRNSSLAFDSSGNAHIVFCQTTLKYMNNVGGVWSAPTEIYTGASQYSDIAVDSLDHIHISSYNSSTWDLIYTYYDGTSWSNTTVDSVGSVGQYSSIAVDSSNYPHISYYDLGSGDLIYARLTAGAGWLVEDVETTGNTGQATSIALDSADKPHIAYVNINEQAVKYAEKTGASWVLSTVDERRSLGACISTATDSTGKCHISYSSFGLRYITDASGTWTKEPLVSGDVGGYNAIALDSTDKVHIAFHDAGNSNLKYLAGIAGSWGAVETADSTFDTGQFCSLALDSSDQPYILHYYDSGAPDILMASKPLGAWSSETVLSDPNVLNNDMRIAVDSTGTIHAVFPYFVSVGAKNLRYAKKSGTSWTFDTIDATGEVGDHCSIAVDPAGYVHVSYFDTSGDGYLRYATNKSGAWVSEVVDPVGTSGVYSGIALDSSGAVHIAYSFWGTTSDSLKYATNQSGSWVLETVDDVGNVGDYCSIAVDVLDRVHIGYNDATNYDLKYALNVPPPTYTLTVSVSPTDGGSVTGSGINCPGDCTETYVTGTPVTLTATPAADYTFDHWTGGLTGTVSPGTVTMDADQTVTAVFLSSVAPGPSEAYSVTFPPGSTAGDFRILSVPLEPVDPSAAAVIGAQIGQYDSTLMRIGYWDVISQSYVEYPFSETLSPGKSGWFLFRNGKTMTVRGEPTATEIGPLGDDGFYYPIVQGWNLVGNPFLNTVNVDEMVVQDGNGFYIHLTNASNTITQPVLWVYSNGVYRSGTVLGVTEGGWVKKLTAGAGRIFFPAATLIPDAIQVRSVPVVADLERPPAPPAAFDSSESGGGGGGGCFVRSVTH